VTGKIEKTPGMINQDTGLMNEDTGMIEENTGMIEENTGMITETNEVEHTASGRKSAAGKEERTVNLETIHCTP
jgi:hypothetical protein